MSKVKIAGLLTPAEALAVLFNASGPQGLGKLQYVPYHTMTPEEAAKVLVKGSYVDYLEGRVIKVDFGNKDSTQAKVDYLTHTDEFMELKAELEAKHSLPDLWQNQKVL